MAELRKYAFVTDAERKPLSPTSANKAWYFVRKKKAVLISKYPLVIRLNRTIPENEVCKDKIHLGIDDGSGHVGISLVQEYQTRNKTLFKATLEHRRDVRKKMDVRKGYRRARRYEKRYRPCRFLNRASSRRKGRVPPSIFQKRQAVIRVVNTLLKYILIHQIHLEDVSFDIRALTDGYKPYGWQYQRSNRLDENLRRACIKRDGNRCQLCGKQHARMETHHIRPKCKNGPDTIKNLVTLCEACHKAVTGREHEYESLFYGIIKANGIPDLKDPMHVMAGKKWLQEELAKTALLTLTTGADTANRRIEWGIEKTHSNDAVCITGLKPDTVDVISYTIKPIKRKSKAKTDNVLGIRHHDLVEYTYRNGETHRGYVTALYPDKKQLNFQSPTKHCKRVNAKKCKVLWKYTNLYWFKNTSCI